MRCLLIFVLALHVSACNVPSAAFRGVVPVRVEVGGSVFDVRVRGRRAEAMRVNPQYAPRFGPIRGRAAFAMEQVSGCHVVRMKGDQALAIGSLDCGDGVAPVILEPVEIECEPVRGSEIRELGQVRIDIDCS